MDKLHVFTATVMRDWSFDSRPSNILIAEISHQIAMYVMNWKLLIHLLIKMIIQKNFLANKILNIDGRGTLDRSNVSWLVHRTVTGDQLPLPVRPAGGERFFIMHTRPAIAEPPKRHKCTFFLLLPDRTSSIPSAYIEIYLRPCYYQLGAAALSPTHSTAGRGNFWI